VVITVAYLICCSAILIYRRMVITPDYLFVLLLPIAYLSGRFWGFFKDWVPFMALLLLWEAMRGVAPLLGMPVHSEILFAERWLFGGQLPTLWLQGLLQHGVAGHILDNAGAVIYLSHFPVTLGVATVLWLVNRAQFVRYAATLLGMGVAAFVFCMLFPTAPPWYAQDHGLFTGMSHVLSYTLPSNLSVYFQMLNPNPVAAFPSLHAAFAFLGFLAVYRLDPRAGALMLLWCLAVWFSVVYLGEHYVLDVIAGVALAATSWRVSAALLRPRLAGRRLAVLRSTG
jgi:membrane-associated phospholipid phosphatase